MKNAKSFGLGALVLAILLYLLRSFICPWICVDNYQPKPLIEFSYPHARFAVTPDSLPGTDSVRIEVYAKNGSLLMAMRSRPGVQNPVTDSAGQRPLKLVFIYSNTAKSEIARSQFLIDDRQFGGIPLMDIIVGGYSGSPTTCPATNNSVTLNQGSSPDLLKFSWSPDKLYKIKVTDNSTDEEFILITSQGADSCYKATLWRSDKYGCLTMPSMSNTSSKEVEVSIGSQNVKITGYDNCDGSTPREIYIRISTPGTSVQVWQN